MLCSGVSLPYFKHSYMTPVKTAFFYVVWKSEGGQKLVGFIAKMRSVAGI
jgi:hypothetical protein